VAPHAESLGVTITFDRSEQPCAVVGSAAALRRALTALVDNALAHVHHGGTIGMRALRESGRVTVTVTDDGVGIDEETLSTLFRRFAHGTNRTATTRREPYGIGLALVREIAQAHNGDVAVASTPGQGATFTLTLPAADADRG
jgi:signal transduction histidine kinase